MNTKHHIPYHKMAETTALEPLAPLGYESAALTENHRDVAKADIINNYWKLDAIDPALAVASLISLDPTTFENHLTYRRACVLHKRQQRQMVLYERCTIEELKLFCANRRITVGSVGKDEKKAIIKVRAL